MSGHGEPASTFAHDGQLADMSKIHIHVQSPVSSKQLYRYLQNQSTAGGLAFLKYEGRVIDIIGKGHHI